MPSNRSLTPCQCREGLVARFSTALARLPSATVLRYGTFVWNVPWEPLNPLVGTANGGEHHPIYQLERRTIGGRSPGGAGSSKHAWRRGPVPRSDATPAVSALTLPILMFLRNERS